jgi:hypothetical protein
MSDACSVGAGGGGAQAGGISRAYSHASLAIKNELQLLIGDMREQSFDTIRFATYRTACKLRFVQKKVNCRRQLLYILPTHIPPLQ